jgi:hypothetical protein
MRADHERRTRRPQFAEHLAQLALTARVETDHRLVEQQYGGAGEHRCGDERFLAHPF